MNKISKILTLIFTISVMLFLNSCVKEKFDSPAFTKPVPGSSANTTIAALNQFYADSLNPGFGMIHQDFIIEGVVCGNDESGNIYKNLYIQDSTGGIDIAINKSGLYTSYRIGQKILVKCQGLYLGNYGGVPELGYIYHAQSGDAIGRIEPILIKDHFFCDDYPQTPPVPKLKTIAGLTSADYSTLIKLDSVFFINTDAGQVYADPHYSSTDRTLMDKNGSIIIVRTSSYANFAGKLTPSKMCSVVGIYSYFSSGQLFIRDTNDVTVLNSVPPVFLYEPLTATFGSFTPYSVTGTEAWSITSYGATMSGYTAGNHANEDWLISSSINLSNYTSPSMSFSSTMNYGNAGDGSLKLYYSNDYIAGDPNNATWTELTGFALSAGAWATTASGNIDLTAAIGTNVHIAFKYTSTTSHAPSWELTNVYGHGVPN